MRPEQVTFGEAIRQGLRAARLSLRPMLALEAAMAGVVAIYYGWPAGAVMLTAYASWQHAGGWAATALATGLAGGVLSEISLVYLQERGRWTARRVEHMVFKFVMFFLCGAAVAEFYAFQAVWFGSGVGWRTLLPKILVDQFGYTPLFATPFTTIALRWQALRYSGSALARELGPDFVTRRMLPVLVTNWMFWLPGVTFIYAMPTLLQTPLFVFAVAVWGLLLPAVMRQERASSRVRDLAPVELAPVAEPDRL